MEIKNLVFFKLLKKVLPSNTNIFVICSVKYHFTEVMTTNLEKKIDFFSEDTLCYISDTKVFKYYESHFLMFAKGNNCKGKNENKVVLYI